MLDAMDSGTCPSTEAEAVMQYRQIMYQNKQN